jgi:hypothetical protein
MDYPSNLETWKMKTVSCLRTWCYEILEDAPSWSRSKLMTLIGKCNKLTAGLKGDIEWLAWYEEISEPEAARLLSKVILWGHETHYSFCEVRCRRLPLHAWLEGCDGIQMAEIVLWLSVNLGRRAPAGWHTRLMCVDDYRRMFVDA